MALTKVTKTGITDNAIDADKIEDGTVVSADIAPGTIENAKLANSSITVNGSSVSLGGSVTAKHIDWQAVKTADFNAVAGEGYFVDTNSVGAVTATLPGSPSAGDTIAFKDYAGTFGTNNLRIVRNGNNIQGVANDSLISTNRASIVLVYVDATKGWLYTNESNVANLEAETFISATGGTLTTSGDYKIHTFTGDGCFVVSSVGTGHPGSSKVDYLVVAGGGAGGKSRGGGGGAGGFRTNYPSCDSGLPVTATTYPVTVGGGGAGVPVGPNNLQPAPTSGRSGSNSVFSTITSTGGGAGSSNTPSCGGAPGGSGGGSAGQGNPGGGTGNTPPVSPPQGNDGGWGANGSNPVGAGDGEFGAGGGGHSTAGSPGVPNPVGKGYGGNGTANSITGTSVSYAGGGGGGGNFDQPGQFGSGGTGGGGDGGSIPGPGTGSPTAPSGTANTGGGGGGSSGVQPNCQPVGASGSGGKGIVIIRYKYQ